MKTVPSPSCMHVHRVQYSNNKEDLPSNPLDTTFLSGQV